MKIHKILAGVLALAFLSVQSSAMAKGQSAADGSAKQRYIVMLADPPLAAYDGREIDTPERDEGSAQFEPTANRFTGERKLNVNSPSSRAYLGFLDQRFEHFRGEAALRLGRQLQTARRFRIAVNGFSADLRAFEAEALKDVPGVMSIQPVEVHRLETDSGPAWVGADHIWDGSAGVPSSGGEGVVVGIIDTGINWDHPAFDDPGEGQLPGTGPWDHVNPYGSERGLCSEAEVLCNDKLVGVYEFVQDRPGTEVVEEETNGKDNNGHGSHVASIAAGNPVMVTANDVLVELSGVAPNANIISYRVCYIGDASDPDDDGCDNDAILEAIEQAIIDGVDALNYSIGSDAYNPWVQSSTTYAFLNVRDAGIFAATSTGNFGPNAATIGSPANAPWITAVGNASHDRMYATVLENLSGSSPPPPSLVGASLTGGSGIRQIVHAKDFGYPLCGTGVAQSQPDCDNNTGASNPWPPGTFNGEIVVCDRGTYGRVEKGKNLQLAGAGGYVLANTADAELQSLVPDEHCLPATHISYADGELLRNWLDSGSGHQGSISEFGVLHVPEVGDVIAHTSSRGPNLPPVEDLLKPDVIAPGTDIIGASYNGANSFAVLGGTSMASPNVVGAAALLKSVHATWTPSMLNSAIMMTATPELAVDFDGSPETPHKRGAGRPRLDQAVNAGLYLNETKAGFLAANPSIGGDPKNLNLPGLVDTTCRSSCNFQRTVTDLAGGADWTASAEGFADGVVVTITPASFTLASGASRALGINVDLTGAGSDKIGSWVYGSVKLASSGLPDMVFPVAVFADGGDLPEEWSIISSKSSGWQDFTLGGLAAMPDGTFTSAGLVEPTTTTGSLPQDPTDDDPYDGGDGVMTVWHTVPADTLWLHAETLASSAVDLDLFVGLDSNGNGRADESEELCASTAPDDLELCDLFTPAPGEYWILVQNWDNTLATDDVTLVSAVVAKDAFSMTAAGTGIVGAGETQTVRVAWDNVNASPATELLGAVGLGTDRSNPNNIGVIPVRFVRSGVETPETLVLMDGVPRGFALPAGATHDLAYVDVPPGVASLTVTATGSGAGQNDNLSIELYRQEFADAFATAPFASAPDTSGVALASASGSGGNGPSVVVSGGVTPGRWFAVVNNLGGTVANIEVTASMVHTGQPFALQAGLWEPGGVRQGINQGYDYSTDSANRSLLWYTYTEDGTPTWYLAAGPEPVGNVWKARLKRFTNDGTLQQKVVVGWVSLTALAEDDYVFSFTLFGDEGSDRIFNQFFPPDCPLEGQAKQSYNGVWSRPNVGVGGATVVVNAGSEGYVHYIYDGNGNPVWLQGRANMRQWTGFCPVCTGPTPTKEIVGPFTRNLIDEDSMTWTLDYTLLPPLEGTVNRTDSTGKLTARVECL